MANTDEKTYGCTDAATARYALELLSDEDDVLSGVRARAAKAELPDIHVSAADGRHLEVLARMLGAKKAVEVGTLAGYSGVRLLRGMGQGAFLHTFELDGRHADVAQETFRLGGLEKSVQIHVGKASEQLPAIAGDGPFDLVFLDADKDGYLDYLGWAAENLRVGGVVIADNTFFFGLLGTPPAGEEDRRVADRMRRFNETLVRSDRFVGTLLPTGEGLALGVKVR